MKKLLTCLLTLLMLVYQISPLADSSLFVSAEEVSDNANVQVKNGSINLENGTATYVNQFDTTAKTYEIRLSRNKNPKYSNLLKEVETHFGAKVLYPDASNPSFLGGYSGSYEVFNTAVNVKFLAGLADKYKLCNKKDTDKKKKRTVLAIYYDLYNDKDGLVTFSNTKKITRKEYYALYSKASSSPDSWDATGINIQETNKVIDKYKKYAAYAMGNRNGITQKFVDGNISRYEAVLIPAYNSYGEEVEEEIYTLKGESLHQYCKDIKKSNILTYNQLYKKYPKAYDNASVFYSTCVAKKYIVGWDHDYLLSSFHNDGLKTDSKGKFNLFTTISYDQALSYIIMNTMYQIIIR